MNWFLPVVLLLLFGDFITTWYGVGILGLPEMNPFMKVLVESGQWMQIFFIKIPLEFSFFYMIWDLISKRKPQNVIDRLVPKIFKYGALWILSAVVINNIFVLLGIA